MDSPLRSLENTDAMTRKSPRNGAATGRPRPGQKTSKKREDKQATKAQGGGRTLSQPAAQKDLIQVVPLDEDTVVAQLKKSFEKGCWYSLAGPTLLAVNPFTNQNTVAVATFKELHRKLGTSCPPHVYTIGQRILQLMPEVQEPQVIVLSGQSGAGKTFSSNLILDYLTHADEAETAAGSNTHPVVEALAASSVLLEAFGNAATVNNRNSSRFGKFVDLHFAGNQCELTSATVKTYLLEASRVTSQQAGEQNFHIFHYARTSTHAAKAFEGFEDPASVFSASRYVPTAAQTTASTSALGAVTTGFAQAGLSAVQGQDILNTVFAIVALGAVAVNDIVTASASPLHLTLAARLLGIDPNELLSHLKYDSLQCGPETVHKPRQRDAVAVTLDAFARFLYKHTFAHVVACINTTLSPHTSDKSDATASIGLLDIFGFETLRTNTLEQLCINFVNERLQRHFVEHMIDAEARLYTEEGLIANDCLVGTTTDACVQLLAHHPHSIFNLLDEACRLKRCRSQGGQPSFAQRCGHVLSSTFKEHFQGPDARAPSSFVVRHYAGAVRYAADNMPSQNKDVNEKVFAAFCTEAGARLFRSDRMQPVQQARTDPRRPVPRSKHATITAQFVSDIHKLFRQLSASRVHYIRCIASNNEEAPKAFDEAAVRRQLRAGGIVDSLRVFAAGRPVHMSYPAFVRTYRTLLPMGLAADSSASTQTHLRHALQQLLGADEITTSADRPLFGRTLIFLKNTHIIRLSQLVRNKREKSAVRLQRVARGFLARQWMLRTKQQKREEEERRACEEAEAEAQRRKEATQKIKLMRESTLSEEGKAPCNSSGSSSDSSSSSSSSRELAHVLVDSQGAVKAASAGSEPTGEAWDPETAKQSPAQQQLLEEVDKHISPQCVTTDGRHNLPRSVLRNVHTANAFALPPM